MKSEKSISSGYYTNIQYHQFEPGVGLKWAMIVAGMMTWPLTVPLALVSRLSDFVFRTSSEMMAVIPYVFGVVLRYEFYRFALAQCGKNVNIGFGTVFVYRDIKIGDNVSIGSLITVHYCDIGSYALIADGCRLYSGTKYHNFTSGGVPMALQGGQLKRIKIGDDTWIGANSVIMNDVGTGAIVAAGSVVASPVAPHTVVEGNPAQENLILTSLRRSSHRDGQSI